MGDYVIWHTFTRIGEDGGVKVEEVKQDRDRGKETAAWPV